MAEQEALVQVGWGLAQLVFSPFSQAYLVSRSAALGAGGAEAGAQTSQKILVSPNKKVLCAYLVAVTAGGAHAGGGLIIELEYLEYSAVHLGYS